MTFSLPDRIDRNHCLITQKYAVYTPPIHELIIQIGDWVDRQQPGAYIYGASRLGKTRCIQWHLKEALESRFQTSIPLVVWNRRPDSNRSESWFWHQLLLASNFQFISQTKPPRKSEAIHLCTQRFISIANSAEHNFVILLIDEAQDMTFNEWKWLVGLQNELDYKGYLLSVFSVGSHQLNYRHEYLASTGNAHIAARFMAAHTRFHGIRSSEEIGYVLNGYDCDSEWPMNSKISYLQYFAPNYYSDGCRLANCADDLWRALVELSPKTVKMKNHEFPMQHIARSIESILFQISNGQNWEESTSYKNWLEEIAKTKFSDHMRIISVG